MHANSEEVQRESIAAHMWLNLVTVQQTDATHATTLQGEI